MLCGPPSEQREIIKAFLFVRRQFDLGITFFLLRLVFSVREVFALTRECFVPDLPTRIREI